MADTKTSAEAAASALAGTELIRGVQSGGNVKITATQIATFVIGAGSVAITSGKTLTVTGTLTFAGTDGSTLNIGAGGALGSAAFQNTSAFLQPGNNLSDVSSASTARFNLGVVLRSYVAGVTLSNNGGTPNTKLDVAAGQVADDTNAAMISVAAGTIDCTTTGANGLDAGSLANSTWYHVYAISKAAGASPALLASTSASSPTMPATYTLKRRIGSFLTDGSAHILAFVQDGDTFYWSALPTDVAVTNLGTSATLYTLSTPLGIKTRPLMRVVATTANSSVIVSSPDEPDLQPASGGALGNAETSPGWDFGYNTNPAGNLVGLYTNTSSQIRARADAASRHLTIYTRGYVDDRGRYA
jgi:hypothetical protein